MREYRLKLEIIVQADDEDEALAMAYGALDPALVREVTEELLIRPKGASADCLVDLAHRWKGGSGSPIRAVRLSCFSHAASPG